MKQKNLELLVFIFSLSLLFMVFYEFTLFVGLIGGLGNIILISKIIKKSGTTELSSYSKVFSMIAFIFSIIIYLYFVLLADIIRNIITLFFY